MDSVISDPGWFSELCDMWPGRGISFQIEEILHKEKTQFQDVFIFKSKAYGNVLVLDGIVQLTEEDEFAYHEMITHVPLFSHPNPKSVLIVGGGDGGAVREVLKHPGVEEIHLCEIDERIIELSKKYFPSISCGLNSPKLTIHIKDGLKFMEEHVNHFDIIITDSCDPIGPAVPLFEKSYYEKTAIALKEGGILCCQCIDIWLALKQITASMSQCRTIYPIVRYTYTSVPSFGGQAGFIIATKNTNYTLEEPARTITDNEVKEMSLKYYNSSVHRASFVFPQFASEALKMLPIDQPLDKIPANEIIDKIPIVVNDSNWFTELCDVWPGDAYSIEIEQILHKEKTQFQDILIFKSKAYGNVLILDGMVQVTEEDEFAYHEMITHVPLFSHPNPKSVLIVGGGDGGAVREVLKHPGVEEIHLCEIDERVIELSKKYFPSISCGLNSPKLTIHTRDGFKFMKEHVNHFDIIITDSPDPIGSAVSLFGLSYYEQTFKALKEDGILCRQYSDIWIVLEQIAASMLQCRSVYPVVRYTFTAVPSFGGAAGFIVASKNKNYTLEEPARTITDNEVKEMSLKYYNSSVHRASFVFPQFASEALEMY